MFSNITAFTGIFKHFPSWIFNAFILQLISYLRVKKLSLKISQLLKVEVVGSIFSLNICQLFRVECWMLLSCCSMLDQLGATYSWDSHANSSHALILDIFLSNNQLIFSATTASLYLNILYSDFFSRLYWQHVWYREYRVGLLLPKTNLNTKIQCVRKSGSGM